MTKNRFDKVLASDGDSVPPKEEKTFTIVVQKWEESEAGWGCRPDGWTMHLNVEAHAKYMKDFSDRQAADYAKTRTVPAEYTRPDGNAYPMDVDEETYEKVKAAKGKYIWGEGSTPPKGKQGNGGWQSV